MLSIIVREEYTQGFNPGPAPLERADAAARCAIEIAPSDNLGFQALAAVQFLRREFSAFRASAERALGINPMDRFTLAYLGFLLAYAGDWERGCALCRQARSLNPHHPGWFWFAEAFDAFRQGNYREALAVVAKINMPHYWRANLVLAASYGHLGKLEAARSALGSLLAAKPDFAAIARAECEKWWQPALVEQMLDGLRKAGLKIPGPGAEATTDGRQSVQPLHKTLQPSLHKTSDQSASRREVREQESPIESLAVLPFENLSGDPEMDYLSEGITEILINSLSQIRKLRLQLSGEHNKLEKPTVNKDAYQLYLKALYFSNRWSPQDLKKAIEYSREAIEFDPGLAPAYAVMATSYAMLGFYGFLPPREAFPKAKAAAQRSLTIDDALAEAHAALSMTHILFDWDWPAGEKEARRALELGGNRAISHLALSVVPVVTGRFEEAIAEQRKAVELDPLSPSNNLVLGAWLYFARHFDEAIEHLKKTVELDPALTRPHELLLMAYAEARRLGAAMAECQVMDSFPDGKSVSRSLRGYIYALAGRTEEARGILEELGPDLGRDLITTWRTTFLCAALNELDMAFELLNKLADQRFGLLTYIKGYAPLDKLRPDPRYGELLRRMGLPQ